MVSVFAIHPGIKQHPFGAKRVLCHILGSVSIPGCNQSFQHFLEFGTPLVLMTLLDGTCVVVGITIIVLLFSCV